MLFLLLSVFKYVRKINWLGAELIFFFLVQDITDRLFFNVKEININDYIVIGTLILIAIIKYINNIKNKQNDKLV